MRSPTNQSDTTEDRRTLAERRAEPDRAAAGDRRGIEGEAMAEAMVDALEDILRWERASERSMRVSKASPQN